MSILSIEVMLFIAIYTTESFEEALEAEKFYSDYLSTTEGETQPKTSPVPVPKKVVRKKQKKVERKPMSESESEGEESWSF